MPKGLVINAFTNEIEYATHNGRGIITGKREEITDEAIRAVFTHLRNEYKKALEEQPEKESFGYYFEGFGTIKYFPEDDA